MSTTHHTLRTVLAALAFLLVASIAGVAISDSASAHVRDRDKHALCNGANHLKHFHDRGAFKSGYYFHTDFGHWSGIYLHYTTHKTARTTSAYDWHRKVVNCHTF